MRALYTAASGMTAQQMRLDTIANNIANVGTTGFKKSRDAFQDLFYQELAVSRVGVPGSGMELGGGVRLATIERNHQQGSLVSTGDPLNAAIQGDAFFVVETQYGERMYTRDGSFTRSAEGRMITASGLDVSGDIILPEQADQIKIDYDGTVHGLITNTGEDMVLGKIETARFVNPAGLFARGGNLYSPTLSSGDPIEVEDDGRVQIVQGFLESSNVDVANELIDMIQAQRVYELNSKVIQAADEALQVAVNLRR
jgi:flagellar basal-body rod protein FlgG